MSHVVNLKFNQLEKREHGWYRFTIDTKNDTVTLDVDVILVTPCGPGDRQVIFEDIDDSVDPELLNVVIEYFRKFRKAIVMGKDFPKKYKHLFKKPLPRHE